MHACLLYYALILHSYHQCKAVKLKNVKCRVWTFCKFTIEENIDHAEHMLMGDKRLNIKKIAHAVIPYERAKKFMPRWTWHDEGFGSVGSISSDIWYLKVYHPIHITWKFDIVCETSSCFPWMFHNPGWEKDSSFWTSDITLCVSCSPFSENISFSSVWKGVKVVSTIRTVMDCFSGRKGIVSISSKYCIMKG